MKGRSALYTRLSRERVTTPHPITTTTITKQPKPTCPPTVSPYPPITDPKIVSLQALPVFPMGQAAMMYLAGLARPMKPVKPTGRPIGLTYVGIFLEDWLELAGPGEPIAEGRRSQQFSRY